MDKYATPGVFVEEVKQLSLSVSSSETAIPIIAAKDEEFAQLEGGKDVDYFEITSWLDVTARAGGNAPAVNVAIAAAENHDGTVFEAAKAGGDAYKEFLDRKAGRALSQDAAKVAGEAAIDAYKAIVETKTITKVLDAEDVKTELAKWEFDTNGEGKTAFEGAITAGFSGGSLPVLKEVTNAIVKAFVDAFKKTAASKNSHEQSTEAKALSLNRVVFESLTSYNNWLHKSDLEQKKFLVQKYIAAFNKEAGLNAAMEDGTAELKKTMLGRSLEAFFVNGGGRAYVCKASAVEKAADNLSDATLLVQAGATLASTIVSNVCKAGRIFGILDAPDAPTGAAPDKIANNENVAIYHPWLIDGAKNDIAPSAVMAGVYAKVDAERGVWKAPANVAVQGYAPKRHVTDSAQGALNDAETPINAIRTFGSGAPLVWGARTGKRNSEEFRYIPVRRLFNTLERDIQKAMKQSVFEPNTSATWEKVRSAIDNYLHDIWRRGGLMGEKPEEAYRIAIGEGVTMDAEQIKNGQMIAEVAVAPTRPAEFVILRFSEKMVGM